MTAGPALRPAAGACESCGRRKATVRVRLGDVAPFAVCADCLPDDLLDDGVAPGRATYRGTPMAREVAADRLSAPVEDDVPPLDWSGTIRLPQPWTSIAQPLALLAFLAVLCVAVYQMGGRTREAFVAMVVVGTVAAPLIGLLDRQLLARAPRWGVHRRRT